MSNSHPTLEQWKDIFSIIQAGVTALSIIGGGIWVYLTYIRRREQYPNLEFSADVNFVGQHGDWWIVELNAIIDNKGKAQHRMEGLSFELNALLDSDPVNTAEKWRNQVDFPTPIAKGSFKPDRYQYFFIDPGVKAKYSYVTRVPKAARFLIFHCMFDYSGRKKLSHVAEQTIRVPFDEAQKED